MENQTLEARIYRVYAQLTPAEKRLANVLLEHQMDLPLHTAGELAAKAAVSKSTAGRLIRALGYKTYPEAKRAIRREQHWGSPQGGVADTETGQAVTSERMIDSDIENIRQTFGAISEQRLEDCARALASAKRVWIIGLRSGHGLAIYAAHYLTLVRADVHVMQIDSGSLSHEVSNFRQGDLLLAIAFRRRPKVLVKLLEAAREHQADTMLVTDLSAGASARAAHYTLRCRTQSPSPFNTFTAATTMIGYLAWKVHALMGDEAIERYRRIDQLVHRLDNVSTPASREE